MTNSNADELIIHESRSRSFVQLVGSVVVVLLCLWSAHHYFQIDTQGDLFSEVAGWFLIAIVIAIGVFNVVGAILATVFFLRAPKMWTFRSEGILFHEDAEAMVWSDFSRVEARDYSVRVYLEEDRSKFLNITFGPIERSKKESLIEFLKIQAPARLTKDL